MASGNEKPRIPSISADQMREVDRLMVEGYGILLMQMMENAGQSLAHLARRHFLGGDSRHRAVHIPARQHEGDGRVHCDLVEADKRVDHLRRFKTDGFQ